MTNLEKVATYLDKASTYYLTTVDGDKPKCRPIGVNILLDDKLYFCVGTFKEVYRQMTTNPYVEICALGEGGFLRYYGKAVFESDDTLAQKILNESAPYLKSIYNDETGYKLGVFHLENATAEFRSMLKIEESYTF